MVKNSPANARATGDVGSIPGLGRFPGGGNGNPLQYFCLENPMDRGAWRATVHRVTQSWTRLSSQACNSRLEVFTFTGRRNVTIWVSHKKNHTEKNALSQNKVLKHCKNIDTSLIAIGIQIFTKDRFFSPNFILVIMSILT